MKFVISDPTHEKFYFIFSKKFTTINIKNKKSGRQN